jgi:hypothetical protein
MRQIFIVVVGLSLGFCLSYLTLPRNHEAVYNCSLAEISPDFPVEVKEGCRKLRMDKINEQRNIQGDSTTSGR